MAKTADCVCVCAMRASPAAKFLLGSLPDAIRQALAVKGMSKHGIISKADVVQAARAFANSHSNDSVTQIQPTIVAPAPQMTAASLSAPVPIVDAPVNDRYVDIPNNNMRKVIAKRLTQSKFTVPHLYVSSTSTIDELLKLRSKLKKEFNVNVSVNDMVIKAAALALRDVPEANGKWDDKSNQRVLSPTIDISVAVATPNGLITPIVTGAEKRGLSDLNAVVSSLSHADAMRVSSSLLSRSVFCVYSCISSNFMAALCFVR